MQATAVAKIAGNYCSKNCRQLLKQKLQATDVAKTVAEPRTATKVDTTQNCTASYDHNYKESKMPLAGLEMKTLIPQPSYSPQYMDKQIK